MEIERAKTSEELDGEKRLAAHVAARWVESGMRVGLGTGSTAFHFIRRLGERVRDEGLRITGLATSAKSAALARESGIPLLVPARGLRLDMTVDGADEIGPRLMLIKGGGGALLREKLVASISSRLVIIADSSKPVAALGKFPLPVEVVPFAVPIVMDRIDELGGSPILRPVPRGSGPDAPVKYFETDQGNWILDCSFGEIGDPPALAQSLATIPGLVEHGLFMDMARAAIVGDGRQALLLRPNLATVPATEHFPET